MPRLACPAVPGHRVTRTCGNPTSRSPVALDHCRASTTDSPRVERGVPRFTGSCGCSRPCSAHRPTPEHSKSNPGPDCQRWNGASGATSSVPTRSPLARNAVGRLIPQSSREIEDSRDKGSTRMCTCSGMNTNARRWIEFRCTALASDSASIKATPRTARSGRRSWHEKVRKWASDRCSKCWTALYWNP